MTTLAAFLQVNQTSTQEAVDIQVGAEVLNLEIIDWSFGIPAAINMGVLITFLLDWGDLKRREAPYRAVQLIFDEKAAKEWQRNLESSLRGGSIDSLSQYEALHGMKPPRRLVLMEIRA